MKMKRISKSTKLPCAFCQGRGIQPGAGSLSCIVCKGRCRITVKQPYSICKECGGRGRKKGANLYCLLCRGKGFIEEKMYPLIVEFPASKTKNKSRKRRKDKFRKNKPIKKLKRKIRNKKSVIKLAIKPITPKIIKIEAEVKEEVKKERESFFKKLLGTFKIL